MSLVRARLAVIDEMTRHYSDNLESLYTREWFIPLMLKICEDRVNKLINQIFQERPSLP